MSRDPDVTLWTLLALVWVLGVLAFAVSVVGT